MLVESRTVATATTFGTNWLITGGLRAGERVVVEGQLTARPGAHVKVAPVPNAPISLVKGG